MLDKGGGSALWKSAVLIVAALLVWFTLVEPQRRSTETAPAPSVPSAPQPGPSADISREAAKIPLAALPESAPPAPAPLVPAPADEPKPDAPPVVAADALSPSFDVVRVEPNGDSVIAGRGAPGATVEMLRDGQSHARVVADASGLFALVPPPLPPGSHEVVLLSIAPDGTRTRSRDSVTVVIAPDRKTKPLVALTAPDRPTVVLSGPDQPEATAAAAPLPAPAPPVATGASPAPAPPPPLPDSAPRAEVRVGSVETQGGGRLFVSGQAAPGATVRLYLNDSLVAPGAAGPDGRFSFVIERGVRPGDYAVRLDDIDPVSGNVRSRAEVDFTVPPAILAERTPAPAGAQSVAPSAGAAAAPAASSAAPLSAASGPPASASSATLPAVAPSSGASAPAPGSVAALSPGATEAGRGPDAPRGTEVARAPASAPGELTGMVVVPEINTAIVARGDNLWRISRRVYGQGIRYTVIYGANQPQIRDPARIYPGQVFVLPAGQPPR